MAKRKKLKTKKKTRKSVKRKGSQMRGRYMGMLNALNRSDKAKARKIKAAKGYPAAIKFARKRRKKSK